MKTQKISGSKAKKSGFWTKKYSKTRIIAVSIAILAFVLAVFAIFHDKAYEQVIYGFGSNKAASFAFTFGVLALGLLFIVAVLYPWIQKGRAVTLVVAIIILIVAIGGFSMNLVGPEVLIA